MPKLLPGTPLSVRNVPSPVIRQDTELEPPAHYLEYITTQVNRHLAAIENLLISQSHLIQETQGASYEGAEGLTTLNIIAEMNPASEVITEILVTGPASTAFTLQLGTALLTLLTDASGKLLLAPIQWILNAGDLRVLSSATAGQWYVHMAGYALTKKTST
jgi:hypothetical protein